MRHLSAALLLTAFILLIGCNAPHDNPLDPASSHYRGTPSAPDLTGYIYSLHKGNRGVSDTYSVIADLDGSYARQLDTVIVHFDNRLSFGLGRDKIDNGWSTLLPNTNFNDTHLENVIGRPFVFYCYGSQGITYELGPYYMWRAIADVPICIEPDSFHIVSPLPQLDWQPLTVSYPVAYQIEVLHIINDTTTVQTWLSPSIPSGVNSIAYPDSLADGRYQWTITATDSFQNAAISAEAQFLVSHNLPL
jgi:hypothetical protein